MATISKAQGMRPAEIDAIDYINGDLADYIKQEKEDRADIVKRLDGIGLQVYAHAYTIDIKESDAQTTTSGSAVVQKQPGFTLPQGVTSHDVIFVNTKYVTHEPNEAPYVSLGEITNLSVSPNIVTWYQPFTVRHKGAVSIRIQYLILVPLKEEE